jgi:hypothetical protein
MVARLEFLAVFPVAGQNCQSGDIAFARPLRVVVVAFARPLRVDQSDLKILGLF